MVSGLVGWPVAGGAVGGPSSRSSIKAIGVIDDVADDDALDVEVEDGGRGSGLVRLAVKLDSAWPTANATTISFLS